MVRSEIEDTGIRITEEQQARLFQSFTQADASTTRLYGGTVLGVAISKQLVGLKGGEIGVVSEPDKGSAFWFTLPLERASMLRRGPLGSRCICSITLLHPTQRVRWRGRGRIQSASIWGTLGEPVQMGQGLAFGQGRQVEQDSLHTQPPVCLHVLGLA